MILERSGVDQTAWFHSQSDDVRPAELDSLVADADGWSMGCPAPG